MGALPPMSAPTGDAQVAVRLVQYETALEAERKRTSSALAAVFATEQRAQRAEAMCRDLSGRMHVVSAQRGQLAHSLDASLRQLGSERAEHAQTTRKAPFDVAPGSWGLLQDLHQLHLKLHDVKVPVLGSPPKAPP